MRLNIMARHPLRLFLSILLVLIVIGGVVWWLVIDSLDPREQLALDYINFNYVHPDQAKAKSLMTQNNDQLNDLGQIVKPGPVHVGMIDSGDYVKVVVFFDDPSMTIQGSRLEIKLLKENGKWKVARDRFRGTDMTFDAFEQHPDYQKVGITEWKEAKLPE